MSNDLSQTWRDATMDLGADLFGIADLTPAHDFIVAAGERDDWLFSAQPDHGHSPDGSRWWTTLFTMRTGWPRGTIAPMPTIWSTLGLNDLASRIASLVQNTGYRSMPIPATGYIYDGDNLQGIYSHKIGAHLSGLAWIGKSCLAVTPRVRPARALVYRC